MENPSNAISVHRVSLTYGASCFGKSKSTPILDQLSLQLPRGSIYGLLGPSGCGKTSLIRCILGILPVSSGDITVFGAKPGSSSSMIPGAGVGYMPQDITLYSDLTILETLWYFASLYGLENDEIKHRSNFLISLLNLPNRAKFIGQLSGGQKRRVSLATALIHKPPLLVLDEPTVGVDPLLRQSIWQHLVKLSESERLTVLITTHYIEEARSANLVGLMRDGKILEQGDPDALLQRYNLDTLEDVFLHLCANEENRKIRQEYQNPDSMIDKKNVQLEFDYSSSSTSSLTSNSTLTLKEPITDKSNQYQVQTKSNSIRQIGTMIRKNLQSLRRSPGYLLFQFLLPMVESILFNLCMGLDLHSLQVAVYNGDLHSNLTFNFTTQLNPKLIEQELYATEFDALQAVKSGYKTCALIIPQNFTENLLKRFTGILLPEMLHASRIHLAPDMSNQLSVQFVQKEVFRAFSKVMSDFLESMGVNRNLMDSPIQLTTPIYGRLDPPFTEFMVAGTILSIVFFAALSLTAMNLVVEKTHGLIERTVIVGVSHFQILFSHLITHTLVLLVQVALLLVMMFAIFKIAYSGPFIWIVLMTIGQSMCGMVFGLFISSVSGSENVATMLSLGAYFPTFLLSGSIWPLEAMNDYLRYFAYVMPSTIATQSMRSIIVRGWDALEHWEVVGGFVVTGGWIVAFLVISTLVVKYKKL